MIQTGATKDQLVAVPGYSHLFLRGAVYYFRIAVPEELRPVIGQREIVRSLRTKEREQAKRLIPSHTAEARARFELAQRKLQPVADAGRNCSDLSDNEIRRLVFDWFVGMEKQSERWWEEIGQHLKQAERDETIDNLHLDETALRLPPDSESQILPDDGSFELDAFLAERGINCPKQTAVYNRLLAMFRTGRLENINRTLLRIERKPVEAREPLFRDLFAHSVAPTQEKSSTLGKLVEGYLAYVARQKSETTLSTYKTPMRVICEVLGESTPLNSITPACVERIFDLLEVMPTNATKKYPGMTARAAIQAAANKADTSRLSPKSLRNYYTNTAALFSFAVETKLMRENPTQSRILRERFPKPEPKRKPKFTDEQLNALFRSPLYLSGARAAIDSGHAGRFFVSLLGLFEGLRLNEACQLYTEDVKEQNGVTYLAIRKERDDGSKCEKRLKNSASKRNLPVHPVLERVGFLDFVAERRRDSKSPRLFPELPAGKTGRYSNPFSKWFARYKRNVLKTDAKATFHSFRHHFTDKLRNSYASDEVIEALGGWSGARRQHRQYGEGLTLSRLNEEISKIEYPELDLSHLYTP